MKSNRVYGVIGISSIMANWNADFSGYPKTTYGGVVFGSDKALKYPMKKMWEEQGKKVLYIKSMTVNEGKKGEISIIPRTLGERYEYLFGTPVAKDKGDGREVLTNLFKAIDVKNFGATFAEAGNNIAITGAVQIGQGFNKYDGHSAFEQPILSPFRDPKAAEKDAEKGEAKNSTLGTKILSDEAHYFYSFTVNPMAYSNYVELEVTDGYTDDDFDEFKHVALTSATSFATNSKIGCENEFGMFVETAEDMYMPNLAEYIEFSKGDEKNVIDVKCGDILRNNVAGIKSIEIYYNPFTTTLQGDINDAKMFDIRTLKEV